ncbi:hypothetical protein OHW27_12080 [Acinetobacter baumannii]|nr:hypothetical protein [Acinetobacter baumannii]
MTKSAVKKKSLDIKKSPMVTIRLHVHLTKKKQMNKVNLSQVLIKGKEELVMEILEIKTTTCGNRSG